MLRSSYRWVNTLLLSRLIRKHSSWFRPPWLFVVSIRLELSDTKSKTDRWDLSSRQPLWWYWNWIPSIQSLIRSFASVRVKISSSVAVSNSKTPATTIFTRCNDFNIFFLNDNTYRGIFSTTTSAEDYLTSLLLLCVNAVELSVNCNVMIGASADILFVNDTMFR